jgi:ankyrin repeat protein
VRHGKYREIEETMNNPEYNLPIDFQDDSGNTLLHVSAQNGNKRVAKLLLRRGATINKQNMAGQTVLHYAQGYGFSELFDYLMSKGADDSLKNADNLTCYEGLAAGDVDAI